MKLKTFSQLNAERAARRARPIEKKKKINQSTRPQAGGPAHKKPGFKQLRLTSDKLIRYYRTHSE